jgi:hypothetical protein
MALIEIDGLPFLNMGGSFHGYVTNNQMVNHPFFSENGWIFCEVNHNQMLPARDWGEPEVPEI